MYISNLIRQKGGKEGHRVKFKDLLKTSLREEGGELK